MIFIHGNILFQESAAGEKGPAKGPGMVCLAFVIDFVII